MHISEPCADGELLATSLIIIVEHKSLGRSVSLLLGQRPIASKAVGLIRS